MVFVPLSSLCFLIPLALSIYALAHLPLPFPRVFIYTSDKSTNAFVFFPASISTFSCPLFFRFFTCVGNALRLRSAILLSCFSYARPVFFLASFYAFCFCSQKFPRRPVGSLLLFFYYLNMTCSPERQLFVSHCLLVAHLSSP